mmetsp:Transcript_18070/g.21949  ORF Transcript_18070/g.21949 Transcript_18070/m.21949 type:complete len:186 (-) Transcript_18070:1081-1638(-)
MLQSILGSRQEAEPGIDNLEPGGASSSSLLPESVSSWWNNEDGEENESCFPSMTYQNRLYGFGICFLLGFVLSFLSSFSLMSGNLSSFAFMYTTGNFVALAGSSFLVGPTRQVKSMCEEHRWVSSTVYLSTLVLTLLAAMMGSSILLVFPLLLIQWCAGIWYCASYVPYARNAIQGFVNSVVGTF